MKNLLILFLLLPSFAWAQTAKEPIQIEAAGSLVWQQSDKTYRAIGDASATRGQMVVKADELIAHYEEKNGNNEIQFLEAKGNVRVDSGGNHAEGPAANYSAITGDVLLQGQNLKLSNAKGDVLTAEQQIQFNDKTGRAFAVGTPVMTRADRKISSDRMDGQFARDAQNNWVLQSMTATQNVVVTSGNGTPNPNITTAQTGFYDAVKGSAILTGNVKISKGPNQMNGERAEINLNTSEARLLPSLQNGRVKALLYQK